MNAKWPPLFCPTLTSGVKLKKKKSSKIILLLIAIRQEIWSYLPPEYQVWGVQWWYFFGPPPHSKISIFHIPIYLYVRAHMGNRPLHISACQMQNIQDTNYSFRNIKLHIWGKTHKKIQCLYHLYWWRKTEKSEHLFYSEIVAGERNTLLWI